MRLTDIDADTLDEDTLQRLIFLPDSCGGAADILLTLGSKKACKYRVPAAASLFLQGRARLLLMSGGAVWESGYPEWQEMSDCARRLGVPSECIISERQSLCTEENLRFCRPILKELLPDGGRVMLLTADFHIRRALLLAQKLLPEWEIIPHPVDSGSCSAKNWRQNRRGRSVIRSEAARLKLYAEKEIIENIDF